MEQQTQYLDPATAPPTLPTATGVPTDAELGRMVREGCYVRGASFGPGPKQSRFLLVFAVPYGPDDFEGETPTLRKAIEAAHEFLGDSDSDERNWQVFDAVGEPRFLEVSLETLPEDETCEYCDAPKDPGKPCAYCCWTCPQCGRKYGEDGEGIPNECECGARPEAVHAV